MLSLCSCKLHNKPYAGRLDIDTLREGSLVIDMIDAKQGNVVWRSSLQGKTQETFQQPSEEGVNDIVYKMFKKVSEVTFMF